MKIKETTIKEWFKKEAHKEARAMRWECDGSYVGSEVKRKVKYKGYEYELFVSAFWESTKHFDYYVTGINRKYIQSESLCLF